MLLKLVIEDYQSLEKAVLELGKFTVVTGPTGSGKSGTIRALRLACFNQRGNSFIRRGAKRAGVQVGGTEDGGWAAGILRGQVSGRDSYIIAPPGNGERQTYTKLAGSVPDETLPLLRMSPLNFSGQFDAPFLLRSSGAEVANQLGELTNVTIVFDAAREANRRRLVIAKELQSAELRLASLAEQAKRFRGLKAAREALALAEEAARSAVAAEKRLSRLKQLAGNLELAENAVWQVETRLAGSATPALGAVETLALRLGSLRELSDTLRAAERHADECTQAAAAAAAEEIAAHQEIHQSLIDAGQCPTCGQGVTGFSQLAVQLYGDRHG